MMNKKVETNEEMLNEVNGGGFPCVLGETIIAETENGQASDCIFNKAIWLG